MYPNPVRDQVTITATETSELKIYNSLGELVKSQTIESGNTLLNLEALRPGIYSIQCNNQQTSCGTFIKQ
jgi:hypothetical protein